MKNSNTYVGLSILALLSIIGVLIYALISNLSTIPTQNSAKRTNLQTRGEIASYADHPANTLEENRKILGEKTGILGQTAYSPEGKILGLLYDAYVHPDTGRIEWVSINIEGRKDAPLVKLKANLVESFENESPTIINISKEDLLEYPVQQRHEKDLIGFISLKNLPDTPLTDSNNQKIGRVTRVTYNNNALDNVYFEVSSPLVNYPDHQNFMIPFKYLKLINTNNPYNQSAGINLTERQIGAIEAFAEIKENQ